MKANTTHAQPPALSGAAAATVFYDGACPLCRKEIAHYRRLAGAGRLSWVDISEAGPMLARHGLSRDTAMARLHVRDAQGNWQTGAWGFAELWSHLPAYRWLATFLRRSRTLPLLDRAYTHFARWRLGRRCNDGFCAGDREGGLADEGNHVTASKPRGAIRRPQTSGERSCA